MSNAFYTIGHSTRPVDEFVALLGDSAIRCVVDVRTIPRSRTNPQYNRDVLPATLAQSGCAYVHIAELGGRRSRDVAADPADNAFWDNASFHNYADYARSAPFRAGLARLRDLGQRDRCAIMCAEAVWWRCHRRIIADYLIADGEAVMHILAPGKVTAGEITAAARSMPDTTLTYPREDLLREQR